MKTVVLLGNLESVFSSESHYRWTLENKLNCKVIPLQENRTSAGEVLRACEKADGFFWIHTHGWGFPGEEQITAVSVKIPSWSYHLDKYWGIPAREGTYLAHNSFHLNKFFSTDGGNDEKWKAANVPHEWLLGGCVEYGCYHVDSNVDIPVLFAGSAQSYHAEYPFRIQMVRALQANYGDRFKIIQGVREHELNTYYGRARVVVGDHIFAGCPRYTSDRLFETIGRGGFIVYPKTEGVTDEIPGLATYDPQNVDSLIHAIDYWLDIGHEKERIERREAAFQWVKANATYSVRLKKVLDICGLSVVE